MVHLLRLGFVLEVIYYIYLLVKINHLTYYEKKYGDLKHIKEYYDDPSHDLTEITLKYRKVSRQLTKYDHRTWLTILIMSVTLASFTMFN